MDRPPANPPYVLLVEDNRDDVELATLAFKAAGFPYEVVVARDGALALSFLRARGRSAPPALILLDLNLPRVSGLEFLELLRADARLSGIPVTVLTSSARESDRARAHGLGVLDYIQKPVDLPGLESAVARIWKRLEALLHHGAAP